MEYLLAQIGSNLAAVVALYVLLDRRITRLETKLSVLWEDRRAAG